MFDSVGSLRDDLQDEVDEWLEFGLDVDDTPWSHRGSLLPKHRYDEPSSLYISRALREKIIDSAWSALNRSCQIPDDIKGYFTVYSVTGESLSGPDEINFKKEGERLVAQGFSVTLTSTGTMDHAVISINGEEYRLSIGAGEHISTNTKVAIEGGTFNITNISIGP